ncbi:hypothetical protein CRG98_012745 [Punica granatum]|uniref:Uncharacterized protein n=1 Tax=Punica granatum TaxID=22663 RepID=A0A2I0KED9_PUNGR|nr:hypothetical protein CRG98_012745 [Punica granatum]
MPSRKQPLANIEEAPEAESASAAQAVVENLTTGGSTDVVSMLSRSIETVATDIKQGQQAMNRPMEIQQAPAQALIAQALLALVQAADPLRRISAERFYRTKPEVSLADLSRLVQESEETVETYKARFKKACHRYKMALFEAEFVQLAQIDLDFEIPKKFEGMNVRDFFELSIKKIDRGFYHFGDVRTRMWTLIGGLHARFWIVQLGSVHLPVGMRDGHA